MRKLVVVLIAFVLPMFGGLSAVYAQSGAKVAKKDQSGNSVFVHITAVLSEKNGGMEATVTGFNTGKGLDELSAKEFKERMQVQDNKLQVVLLEGNPRVTHVTLPSVTKLSSEISRKLGSAKPFILGDGISMVQKRNGKRMLWFEIQ